MSTVLVVGLGDLGSRVVAVLARSRRIERLVGASRSEEAEARVAQARLVARLGDGPRHVEFVRHDVADVGATSTLLARLDPDAIVMAASRHTWLQPAPRVPYGAWLPLQLPLVQRLMEAGPRAPVVCLPYPDAVGPALAPLGLAPALGAGNVTETAVKLELLAGDGAEASLVLHHAAQRYAFPAFASLGGDAADGEEPPWLAEVTVDGKRLPAQRVDELFHADYPLPPGRESHDLTAAATAEIVEALLADEPRRGHAPAPNGLPGGYPVRISSAGVELDLPATIDRREAVRVNEEAARWDGIAAIEPDGTIVYTDEVAAAVGFSRIAPHGRDAAADELERWRDSTSS